MTHDQHLLSSIVDQFWWVHDTRVERYAGDLESYLQQRLKRLKEQQASIKAEKAALSARPGDSSDDAGAVNKKPSVRKTLSSASG